MLLRLPLNSFKETPEQYILPKMPSCPRPWNLLCFLDFCLVKKKTESLTPMVHVVSVASTPSWLPTPPHPCCIGESTGWHAPQSTAYALRPHAVKPSVCLMLASEGSFQQCPEIYRLIKSMVEAIFGEWAAIEGGRGISGLFKEQKTKTCRAILSTD